MTTDAGVGPWWAALSAATLVGTARRTPPAPPSVLPVPPVVDGPVEPAVLDQIAVGSALRRAGTVPAVLRDDARPEPAPDDRWPVAPPRARQLLDLLLTQSPVGPRLARHALRVWLRCATEAEVRVHHSALVGLLTALTPVPELHAVAMPVLDRRGSWLAGLNPAWSWALAPEAATGADLDAEAEWEVLGAAARATLLRTVRATDPGRGLRLLESTWDTDTAAVRTELLQALSVGLSPDDETFLERALDDRASGVREAAYRLLDRLPGSARAQRLGALLEPLVSATGLVRRKVHVELPDTPDQTTVRDGLGKAPKGRSQRGLWLQRLAAGAPLDTWTRSTGLDPATVVRTLDDADALLGIRQAATGRRDAAWCRALLEQGWDPLLVDVLPADEVAALMVARLGEVKTISDLVGTVRAVPGPWSAEVSDKVVARLGRLERPVHALPELTELLASRLHPDTAPAVQRLARTDDGSVAPLRLLAQYLTLVPTITEAFR